MKYIVAIFLLILIGKTDRCQAQSFYNSPSDSIEVNSSLGQAEVLGIDQFNDSHDTIVFVWKKITENIPAGWNAVICDNRTCYFSLMDSGTTWPVAPNWFNIMDLHITPLTTPGTAIVQYTIYDTHFPQFIDTLTWIVNVTSTGIDQITSDKNKITFHEGKLFYENSNNDFNELSVIDLQGKIIFNTGIRGNGEIDFPQLAKSVYLIRMSGANNQFVQKIMN